MYNVNKLIFMIYIPIAHEENYSFFHIFPVPIQNLTILPPEPYLVLGKEEHLWSPVECPNVEDTFLCHGNPQTNADECFPSLLQGKPGHSCSHIPVYHVKPLIEQVDQQHILIITTTPVEVFSMCQDASLRRISSPTEIRLTSDCLVKINNLTYHIQPTLHNGSSFLLPELLVPSWESSTHLPIQLHNVKFDDITELHAKIKSLKPITVSDVPDDETSSYLLICIAVVMLICISICILVWRKRRQISTNLAVTFSRDKTSMADPEQQTNATRTSEDDQMSTSVPPRSPF